MKKISLIVTILNEEQTIIPLLESIFLQSHLPQEIIITDGGSSDDTVALLTECVQEIAQFSTIEKFKKLAQATHIVVAKGNRSVGRNHAIKLAQHELIAITDAGCILETDWLHELYLKYTETGTKVVAGYYSGIAHTSLQKAIIPYVLVMPDKIDEANFLPATRSMLIEKKLFQEMGGFDEKLSDNEDYAFAKRLEMEQKRRKDAFMSFAQKAIVYWTARTTLPEFYTMIFRFARGDIFAQIIRPKVVLVFARYVVFLYTFIFAVEIFKLLFLLYFFWAIYKNKKYVGSAWVYLPTLQFIADIAVIFGSVAGALALFSSFFGRFFGRNSS